MRALIPTGRPAFGGLVDELINHPFSRWFDDEIQRVAGEGLPPVNIRETQDAYQLELVAPGLDKADFKLQVEGDVLTIQAEKKEEKKEDSGKLIRREFKSRSFKRSFTLNEGVDTEQIKATYANGVLQVALPKKAEKVQQNREIEIQ